MCLIIASLSGAKPTDDTLGHAYSSNPDGAGIAWFDAETRQIKWAKGLDLEKLKAKLAEISSSFIIHCRIGTVGPKRAEALTHPFPITAQVPLTLTGSANAVLFHNGTFSSWKSELLYAVKGSKNKVPPGPWSDSRAMAYCVHTYGEDVIPLLDDTSRYVVFAVNEKGTPEMSFFGLWHDNDLDKCRYSNRMSCAFNEGGGRGFTQGASTGSVGPQQGSSTGNTGTSSGASNASAAGTNAAVALVNRSQHTSKVQPKTGYNPWKDLDATASDVGLGFQSLCV